MKLNDKSFQQPLLQNLEEPQSLVSQNTFQLDDVSMSNAFVIQNLVSLNDENHD